MLLLDLEATTGLVELTEGERNVLAALVLCGGANALVRPSDLRQQPLAASLTHPTYHRMLRGLIERGIVSYSADDSGTRGYSIAWTPAQSAHLAKSQPAV
jgi:DNA-binding MarR family transcriptional regulator